jgi:hypothetical protein
VEKYGTARQATDYNVAQAHCMLDNYGYTRAHTHSLTICNTYCFQLQQWLHERTYLLLYMYNTFPALLAQLLLIIFFTLMNVRDIQYVR